MKHTKKFRNINETERDIINKSLLQISDKNLSFFGEINYEIFIATNIKSNKITYPLIFLIPKNLIDKINEIKPEINIISAGLYFGFIKKGKFYLSLEGAEFLYKKGIYSDVKRIYVNKKGEKSILYGNNILKNMVIRAPSNLQKEDFLLVFNKLNEVIAIAKSIVSAQIISNIEPDKIIAINLNDKGVYLRKKQ